MAALTADRNTPRRAGDQYEYPVAASTEIFAGSLVVLDSDGNVKPGETDTGLVAVGRADEYAHNTGSAGALRVKVRAGTFKWASGDAIAKDSIGDTAYVVDDQTVSKDGTGKSPAGRIVDVESDGVWVRTDPLLALASAGLLPANNLSDVGSAATARANIGANVGVLPVEVRNLVGSDATSYGFVAPFAMTITKIRTVLLGDALAAGDATITAKIDGTPVTNGVVTISESGSSAGDLDEATPSAANVAAAGEFVELAVGGANTNVGAFALATIEYTF